MVRRPHGSLLAARRAHGQLLVQQLANWCASLTGTLPCLFIKRPYVLKMWNPRKVRTAVSVNDFQLGVYRQGTASDTYEAGGVVAVMLELVRANFWNRGTAEPESTTNKERPFGI